MNTRLQQQLTFLREMDKLKRVIRQALINGGERKENTAEHSWHVALAAFTLAEHADTPVDVVRVAKMLLVHDIVEIDAGDAYAYDTLANVDKLGKETQAAERIFGLLPDDIGAAYRQLWEEFEAAETDDARFANAIDQIMPFLHNYWSDGESWMQHQPTYDQVHSRLERRIGGGSAVLWAETQRLLEKIVENGWLEKA